MQVELDSDRSA